MPGPVLNFISKSALKQATSWVKKESEAAPEANIPGTFASPEMAGAAARGGGFAVPAKRRGVFGSSLSNKFFSR